MPRPERPRIYHITHVDNLPAILAAGGLASDAGMAGGGGPRVAIGMPGIKSRRLRLPVPCHPGTWVGEYVPFYFCPRSVMLYVIHCANHPELGYRGGQGPIVHLVADLAETVEWAEGEGRRWAFSLSNAGARYAEFCSRLEELDRLNWEAIGASDFRKPEVKESKQAEFLVYRFFPWGMVREIGVFSSRVRQQVEDLFTPETHRPPVRVRRGWYY